MWERPKNDDYEKERRERKRKKRIVEGEIKRNGITVRGT